ncbi:conserved hypothetical protein [Neospora caninum Liverpool]|uniref:YL1 nuclear domain-containing protein n=1 Tax=Neospora caninum (strain Liverpool) TaxID=572307 RepID=F0VNE0_NEOCL|nr:conserved hypothetical protein [Neospora caninum Liverpool]CBZ55236.1 conserved hypothetical protein [Neospora caninum Liverpool]CEL69964.1 TPA: YL1 nuclear domain-containing protein [Neospora caninum Liverpool]|eukprot:XP_003885264.1 conserved hypothetical protein [Neospora caninum Liverpool]
MSRPGRRDAVSSPEGATEEEEQEEHDAEASPGDGEEENGDEGEGEESEEGEEDDDEETSSEEEEVGIALQLPVRSTRGHTYQRLVGDALREDQEFWNHSTWAEEDDEDYNCSEGEEVYEDIIDSDFDRAEDDSSEDDDGKKGRKRKEGETKRERGEAGDIVEDDEERAKKKQKRNAFQDLWKKKQQQQKRQAEAKKKPGGDKRRGPASRRVSFQDAGPDSEADFEGSEGEKGDSPRTPRRGRKAGAQGDKQTRAGGDDGDAPSVSRRQTRDSTRQHTRCVARRLEEEELHRSRKERNKKESERGGRDKMEGFREPTLEEHLAEAQITEARNVASLMVIEEKEEARKLRYVDVKKNIYKGDFDTYISWASWLLIGDPPPEEEVPPAAEEATSDAPPAGSSSPSRSPDAGDSACARPEAAATAAEKLHTGDRVASEETAPSQTSLERIKREDFQNKGDAHGGESAGRGDTRPEAAEDGRPGTLSGGAADRQGGGAQPPLSQLREETPETARSGSPRGEREEGRPGEAPGEGKGDQEEWNPNLDDYAMELRMFTDGKFPDIYNQEPPPPPPRYVCPITGLEAKYLDPLTGIPYATAHAFKCLRETYHRLREQQLFQALHQARQMLDVKAGELGVNSSVSSVATQIPLDPSLCGTSISSSHVSQHFLLATARGAHPQNRGDSSFKPASASPSSRSGAGGGFLGATAGDVWTVEDEGKKGRGRRGGKMTRGGRGRKGRKDKTENYACVAV